MNVFTATQIHAHPESEGTVDSPVTPDYSGPQPATFQHPPGMENPIIREFLLLRHRRNGGALSEVSTPIEECSSCLSDSFSSSQVSVLSLRTRRRPPTDETPDTDPVLVSEQMDAVLHVSPPPSAIFMPIDTTDSSESTSRGAPTNPVLVPMRGSSVLTRYRRLMEDLEVSQGIRLASFTGVQTGFQTAGESDYDDDDEDDEDNDSYENSFTESMLAVDAFTNTQSPQDLVTWLAQQFRRSKKTRCASIDGIIMSHGVSQSFQNLDHRHRHSRWKPLKSYDSRQNRTHSNLFTRFFNHWRTSHRSEPVVPHTFLINRPPGDRFSSFF